MSTKKFVVREGFTFGSRGEYGPGSVLELDESAGVAFADKLRPAGRRDVDDEVDNQEDADKKKRAAAFDYLPDKQRNTLIGAGYDQDKADAAKDEELGALAGIDKRTIELVRENKVAKPVTVEKPAKEVKEVKDK